MEDHSHSSHEHEEHKHSEATKESSEEDVRFDFSKIKKLFSIRNAKRNSVLLMILLILIPVVLTVYIRVQPQYLHITNTWAANSVNNYYRNQIAQSVNSQYPNLPQQNKDTLIDQQLAQFLESNKDNIAEQVRSTGAYFRQGFQYQENNVTYTFLGDLDSYLFLRYARNLLTKGMYCDEIRDNQCWDNHMYAPIGIPIGRIMHPYGIFYLYKFLHVINPTINLMQSSFLLPTFLAVLAAIAAFFVGRKIMNTTAGFFAAMLLAVSPMFLSRTLGSDTDVWNVMFPLIILWIFLEAFEAKSLIKKSILAGIAGLLIGIFSFAWPNGWWYIFDFLLATLIVYIFFVIIKHLIKHKKISKAMGKEIVPTLVILAVLVLSSLLFVSLFFSFDGFKGAITEPFYRAETFKEAAHADYWPNIQTTVAEMNEADIATIISQTAFGKNIFFGIALLGIIFTLVSKKPSLKEYFIILGSAFLSLIMVSKAGINLATRSIFLYLLALMIPVAIAVLMLLLEKKEREKEHEVDIKPAILLIIWFVGMIYASTQGVRFILLLIPAFAVAIGVAVGYIFQYLSSMLSKEFKISHVITKIAVFVLLCLILIMPIKAGLSTGESFVPSMTSGWWNSLTKINQESAPNAIINSWWDFGHWFKYVADRAVTVDGGGQDYQLAHWMGTILATDNEDQAVNTIRMLDCGSRETYLTLLNSTDDILLSVNLTKTIIMQSKEDARKTLEKAGIGSAAIDTTLNYAFCSPPEHFLITSGDMIGKSGVWAHFGYWDFNKAYMIREVRTKGPDEGIKLLQDKFGYTEDQASVLYYDLQSLDSDRAMNDWISPWPNYLIGDWVGCQRINATQQQPSGNDTNNTNASAPKIKQVLACSIGRTLSESTDGRTVLEYAILDLDDYKNSSLVLGAYDTATGYRKAGGNAIPSEFVLFFNDTIQRVKMDNATFPYSVLIDMVNERVLITDPLLSESLFTQLFYLDGRYTTRFEKFSDVTDITGSRIIIWKVKW